MPFFGFVRNLKSRVFVHHDRLEKHMVADRFALFGSSGAITQCLLPAETFLAEAHRRLQQDPCVLIKDPFFVAEW